MGLALARSRRRWQSACMPPPLAVRAAEISRLVRDEARRRGVRWTNQRQIIVDRFVHSGQHLSVEDLHRLAREADPTVSAATVYRTVNLLVELGIAHKRHFDGTGSASFEVAFQREHHDHLVCLSCGSIQEFQRDSIERIQEEVAREYGFTLAAHRLELYGYCAACRASGKDASATLHRPPT
ncbi:transcriptional repressor [Planctomycetota bacterium]|nr:transcriptional repressor [Planctomycetota bacterium]